jgi:hypothetical protein
MKRQTLGYVVVALSLSCSPDYKSGVTECNTDGKCPSGYVCGAASTAGGADVCYSQAETNPGSGGSGGSGGVGGSIGPCSPSSTDRACAICGKQSCCSQVNACESQPSCLNLLNCIGDCPSGSDTTCMNGCETSYPSGVANLDSFATCLTNYCSASCSGGGGEGGSAGGNGRAGGTGGSTGSCPVPAAGGACNVFPSCGCPTGQACSPNTQVTGLKCFPSGSLGEGADCTSGDCASGLGCFGDVCKRYCQFDSDCPAVDSAQSCVQTTWSPGVDIQGVLMCTHVCDPVFPHSPRSPLLACPVGFGCSAAGTSYPGATDCEPQSGSGVSGSSCSADSDCSPGFYCSNGGTCIKYCSTSADCPASSTCHTFSTPEYAGTTSVGYCSGAGADASVPDARAPDARVPDARPPDSGGQTCPTPAAGGTCNVFPACGCPTGQVCYPNTQATGLTCITTAGLGEGAACNGKGCAQGLGCFGGVCKKYCQSASDCTAIDSAQSCVQTTWSAGVDIQGVLVCARVCDPVSPQNPRSPLLACPVGFGCTSMNIFPGASDCVMQSGSGISGSTCSTDHDCTPGYYCSVGNTCIKYCYTAADCPTGMTCVSFTTTNYAGTTQVNHCR